MRIWKNGKEPPYMYGQEKLNAQQIKHAVTSMSFTGLGAAAACFIHLAQSCALTPEVIMGILEENNKPPSITVNNGNMPFTFAALREDTIFKG